MPSIKPTGWRILIKPDPAETKSPGGIIIQTENRLNRVGQIFGTVVDIGPQAWKQVGDGTPWAKVGDRVSYAKYGGTVLTDPEDGEEYVMLNDQDVWAIIDSDKPGIEVDGAEDVE